jgi:hypothetical protein
MAISTKQVLNGILAEAVVSNHSGAGFMPVSHSSDSFESFAASPDNGNSLGISVVINSATFPASPTGSEILRVSVWQSEDLKNWGFVTGLGLSPAPSPINVGQYSASYTFPTSPPAEKYLRLQFHVDDPSLDGSPGQTLPQPATDFRYEGTCWVTMSHQ